MSRYIEVEPLISDLDKGLWGKDWDKVLTEAIINDAPSIDIVPCGECKWRNAKMMPKSVKCLFSGKDDDFCSYGEREGEE